MRGSRREVDCMLYSYFCFPFFWSFVMLCLQASIVVPPDMGYGEAGQLLDIPIDATLTFDFDILFVSVKTPPPPNVFAIMDKDEDGKITEEEMNMYYTDKGGTMPEGLFEHNDEDKDGFVTWYEFKGPKGDVGPNGEVEVDPEVLVDVYEGPTKCNASEWVREGRFVKLHYTGTIDESSATGEKGSVFDSSRDGDPIEFELGIGLVIEGASGFDFGYYSRCC